MTTLAAGVTLHIGSFKYGNAVVEAIQLPPIGEYPSEADLEQLYAFLAEVEWYSDYDESLTIENDGEDGAMVNALPGDWIIKEGNQFGVREPSMFQKLYKRVVH